MPSTCSAELFRGHTITWSRSNTSAMTRHSPGRGIVPPMPDAA